MIYGDNTLVVRTCKNLFARYESEDFDLNDKNRSEKSIVVNDLVLEELPEEDPYQSTRDLVIQLNCSSNTVLNRLWNGEVQKSGKWVSQKLLENNMNQRLTKIYNFGRKLVILLPILQKFWTKIN